MRRPFGCRDIKADEVRRMIADYTAELNRPGTWIIDDAVELAAGICDPYAIIVYGPTAKGYVDDRRVTMLVIILDGDTESVWMDVVGGLALNHIDGDVEVYTLEEFYIDRSDSYSLAYDAVKTGVVYYGPQSVIS